MADESPAALLIDEQGRFVGVPTNPLWVNQASGSSVQVVGAVGVTGPVRVDRVGITGYVQVTGPVGVTGLVQVVGAVGVTGPVRVDSVGGTGPFRVDSVGVTGPVFVAGFGAAGTPTAGLLSVQGVSGAQPHPVVGAQPVGITLVGNPLVSAGLDAGRVRSPSVLNAQPTGADYGWVTRNVEEEWPTFHAVYDRIVPAANKYMATLFNTSSTRKVVITRIWVYLWQVNAVNGVILEQELRRITARTAGTAVTPAALDTADSLSAGITADHNSTAVSDSDLLKRVITTSEEVVIVQAGPPPGTFTGNTLAYERQPGTRGIVLRQNQGLTIKNITSSTVGTVSYVIEFLDEVA